MKLKILLGFFAGFVVATIAAYYAYTRHAPDPQAASAASNVMVTAPLTMSALQRERPLRIYLPPGYATSTQRYPVLYMHDAQNLFDNATAYAGEWGIDEALNTLAVTHGLELIVVGIDNGGEQRMTELNPWDHEHFGKAEGDQYLAFLIEQVKPKIDAEYRTLPDSANTVIMGSSMGGLISHYAARQYPHVFGKAGIFSPSYWVSESAFGPERTGAFDPSQRLFFLVGESEGGDMLSDFNRMRAQVAEQSPDTAALFISVPHAQHNETFWRSQFVPAILWLMTRD